MGFKCKDCLFFGTNRLDNYRSENLEGETNKNEKLSEEGQMREQKTNRERVRQTKQECRDTVLKSKD